MSYRWLLCLAVVAAESPPPQAAHGAAPRYLIIELGTLGGRTSAGMGINNLGQVVGGADGVDGIRHCCRWEGRSAVDLGSLPGEPVCEATDINEGGTILCNAFLGGPLASAFIWEEGVITDLGDVLGPSTYGRGINDAGTVAGFSLVDSDRYVGVVWIDGVITEIRTPKGNPETGANAIDESGRVAGAAVNDNGPAGAMTWLNGEFTYLGGLGGEFSQAKGMNDHNQVVGWARRAGDDELYAFLWDDGVMIDLTEALGTYWRIALDINNRGQIISPVKLYDPVLGELLLDDLVPAASGWSVFNAKAINDVGQIVGAASINGARRAFLMTPLNGDVNNDGLTDPADGARLAACFTGPLGPVRDSCKQADLDRDGDVDLRDWQAYEWAMTMP